MTEGFESDEQVSPNILLPGEEVSEVTSVAPTDFILTLDISGSRYQLVSFLVKKSV